MHMITHRPDYLLGYIFQAEHYCHECEDALPHPPAGMDERDYDSSEYAKPFCWPEESDIPDHCAACGNLIDVGLTGDGIAYTLEAVQDPTTPADVRDLWADLLRRHGVDVD